MSSHYQHTVTTAIVNALAAGAMGSLTDASKTAISDGYNQLKGLLNRKYGARSDMVQALDKLEAKPQSQARKDALQEEIALVKAAQDQDILAVAKRVLTLVNPQQAGMGKYSVQNNALVQGQVMESHASITMNFGERPKER